MICETGNNIDMTCNIEFETYKKIVTNSCLDATGPPFHVTSHMYIVTNLPVRINTNLVPNMGLVIKLLEIYVLNVTSR